MGGPAWLRGRLPRPEPPSQVKRAKSWAHAGQPPSRAGPHKPTAPSRGWWGSLAAAVADTGGLSREALTKRAPVRGPSWEGSCLLPWQERLAAWEGAAVCPLSAVTCRKSTCRVAARPPGRGRGAARGKAGPREPGGEARGTACCSQRTLRARGSRTPRHPHLRAPRRPAGWLGLSCRPSRWVGRGGPDHRLQAVSAGVLAPVPLWPLSSGMAGPSCVPPCVHVLISSSYRDPVCGIRATRGSCCP